VVIADINEEGAKATADKIARNENTLVVKMNVASEGDWKQTVEATITKWGRVDTVINNAGTSYRNKVCLTSNIRLMCRVKVIDRC